MAKILYGPETAKALDEKTAELCTGLKAQGIEPCLAIVRVGEKEADLAYERGVLKRAEKTGIRTKVFALPEDCAESSLLNEIKKLNEDREVHGILLFRPLPKHLDESKIMNSILPEKDADGVTDASAVGVYTGREIGYPPCTPDAVMKILEHSGYETKGRRAVIVGRSLVVGKPLAMMLLKKDATVTVCHTKTMDLASVTKEADIVIAAAGHPKTICAEHVRSGQIVIDVGINTDSEGKLTGDISFEEVEPIVEAITPVPRGVGAVTVSVLLSHVAQAAEKEIGK